MLSAPDALRGSLVLERFQRFGTVIKMEGVLALWKCGIFWGRIVQLRCTIGELAPSSHVPVRCMTYQFSIWLPVNYSLPSVRNLCEYMYERTGLDLIDLFAIRGAGSTIDRSYIGYPGLDRRLKSRPYVSKVSKLETQTIRGCIVKDRNSAWALP